MRTPTSWAIAILVAGLGCAREREPGGDVALASIPRSRIEHVVVLIQENHSFDALLGTWCQAPAGSAPRCTEGPACCEAAPAGEPGTGIAPTLLDDRANGAYDPPHSRECMLAGIAEGRMDGFIAGPCGDPRNFALADPTTAAGIRALAEEGAVADRFFHTGAGPTAPNILSFWTGRYADVEGLLFPAALGRECYGLEGVRRSEPNLGALLDTAGVSWAWYAEGLDAARARSGGCAPDPACPVDVAIYPCSYDPSDVAAAYFAPERIRDLADFERNLAGGTLPSVVFLRALGFRSEHPGANITISEGAAFVSRALDALGRSTYAERTLALLTYDESGGFFDHVPPPPASPVDGQPYGLRVPLIARGPFARRGTVSHVPLEPASIIAFVEWNWLGGTGHLGARDASANNLGSLLDPERTGLPVPEGRGP